MAHEPDEEHGPFTHLRHRLAGMKVSELVEFLQYVEYRPAHTLQDEMYVENLRAELVSRHPKLSDHLEAWNQHGRQTPSSQIVFNYLGSMN